MPLEIPDGTACFIDANILYYHFVETPLFSQACSLYLERVASGAIPGHCSVHVLAEAVHKVMLAEAAATFGLARAGLVNWLQHHRGRITQLRQFRQAAEELLGMGLSIVATDGAIVQQAAQVSMELGLLTNDAMVVALMQRHGLTHLVTNDDDFDAVPSLTVWKPR